MNTVTAEQFVQQGFAAKIANGECVVIDEQFAESPLVKDITVQHRGGSELYMILYADVTDPSDTVTGRADDTFRITWIKPNPDDAPSVNVIAAYVGELEATVASLQAEREDLQKQVNNLKGVEQIAQETYDQIWDAVYPAKNMGRWDYPAQIARHVGDKIDELARNLAAAEALLPCPDCEGDGVIAVGFDNDPNVYEAIEAECARCKGTGKYTATPQPAPAVDGGQVGKYVVCHECDGTGKLFVPETPPAVLPELDSDGQPAPAGELVAAVKQFAFMTALRRLENGMDTLQVSSQFANSEWIEAFRHMHKCMEDAVAK